MLRILGVLFALVFATRTAAAQRAPDMATLDRGDGITKVGLDLGYSSLDTHYSGALRFELYGQYVLPSGLGFYGALPMRTRSATHQNRCRNRRPRSATSISVCCS